MPLTATAIKQAKPKDKPYKLSDEKGMYLLINPKGAKYWRMKYRYSGKEKTLALGVYPDISLTKAREKRQAAREKITDGIDPSVAKRLKKLHLYEVCGVSHHGTNIRDLTWRYLPLYSIAVMGE